MGQQVQNQESIKLLARELLPWPISTIFLMCGCALAGWICADGGQDHYGPGANMATLIFLIGTVPFFARRTGGYTLSGLLMAMGVGVFLSLASYVFKTNFLVIVFLVMGSVLGVMFHQNDYGRSKQAQIELEKIQPKTSRFIASKTEQEQNLLHIYDFVTVLLLGFVSIWLYQFFVF